MLHAPGYFFLSLILPLLLSLFLGCRPKLIKFLLVVSVSFSALSLNPSALAATLSWQPAHPSPQLLWAQAVSFFLEGVQQCCHFDPGLAVSWLQAPHKEAGNVFGSLWLATPPGQPALRSVQCRWLTAQAPGFPPQEIPIWQLAASLRCLQPGRALLQQALPTAAEDKGL